MIGTSQLINAFGAPVCFTDTTDIFKDRSGVALYSLDYDASDAGGASGKFGEAAIFNGTSSSIVVPNNILSTNDHSISMWFNLNDTAGIQTAIEFDYENRIIFRPVSSDSNKANIGSSGWFNHGLSFSTGQWYHLVITFSAGNPFKIYINGVLSYTGGNSNINALSNDNIIGAGNSSGGNGLDGKIDQVRIFNTALTQSQVTQLYQENDSTVGTHLFGCIANYNLDGSAKESMGTTAYDGTETDITYRYDGTPTAVDFGVGGKSNYGARFNGSSSNIQINKLSGFTNYNFTLSVWIKTTDSVGYAIAFRDPIYMTLGPGLFSGGTSGMGIYDGTNQYFINNAAMQGINDGNWHHIVMTHDGTNLKGYIDGSLIGTVSTGTTTQFSGGTNYNRIGVRADGNTAAAYDGDIDQLRIFNKAISAAEVSKLYGNGAGEIACTYTSTTDIVNYPTGTTPVAYYKMDNSSEDYSTGGYDGTDTNIEYRFGRFGQAAVFNGSSSYIQLPALPITVSNDITFSAWVNGASDATDATIISTLGENGLEFRVQNSAVRAVYRKGGSWYGSSTVSITANAWNHIVLTYEQGVGFNIYVNNNTPTTYSETGTLQVLNNNATDINTIGRYADASSGYYDGKIDQVRIYDAALTSDQVTELYNEKQVLTLDTITEPTGNLRFDEFWASYDDGQTNRAEFKSGGQIVDFNTYSEGHAVLNQNPQTSGKYYLEIQLLGIQATEAEFVGVFNRSSNTVYNSSGYFGKNPVDGNYGAGISHEGSRVRIGNSEETGFTDLNIGVNDIYCLAVDVDDKRIWFGRRDGLSDNSITWNKGNPNGLYGGLKVDFVPSDVIVAHISETYQRYAEFKVLDHADMLEPPFNFSYLNGAFTPSLTENESSH